jgi:hypothetical protein
MGGGPYRTSDTVLIFCVYLFMASFNPLKFIFKEGSNHQKFRSWFFFFIIDNYLFSIALTFKDKIYRI